LYSILLIGTELIKEFLVTHQREGTSSIISPFPTEATLISTRFTLAEIQVLIKQYSNDKKFELDEFDISFEIYSLTHGHKGLVGSCCSYIESKMMQGKRELTCDNWNKMSYKLTKHIMENATYNSITRTLPHLSEDQREILGHVLHYSTHVVSKVSDSLISCCI